MTSREFLNIAHAVLVEEFLRPAGSGAPTRSLMDALEMASNWAEGYVWIEPDTDALTAGGSVQQTAEREPTEEEIVAQNNRTLAWLEGRMSNVKGGFGTK